ncbi:hypothetical protein IMSAGC019_03505 [Lachnospiraceae bacterium]|nr:hypothetical protein IMSAGC019_03505 [Lachnospiraceae bacterium]
MRMKNYDGNGRVFRRPSARGIIIKDGKAAIYIAGNMIITNFRRAA